MWLTPACTWPCPGRRTILTLRGPGSGCTKTATTHSSSTTSPSRIRVSLQFSHLPSSCQDHQFRLNNMQYNSIFIHWLFWGNVFNLTLAQKSTNLWILSRWILLSELSGYFEFICANGCHEIVFSGFRSLSSPAVKGNGQKSNADHWISNSRPMYERRRVHNHNPSPKSWC